MSWETSTLAVADKGLDVADRGLDVADGAAAPPPPRDIVLLNATETNPELLRSCESMEIRLKPFLPQEFERLLLLRLGHNKFRIVLRGDKRYLKE